MSGMHDQLSYMYGLERFGIRPGLSRVKAVMEALGHPEQQFRSVHISGTNGKGSTAAFLDAILRQGGLKIGLYTSPHIYSFNERIRIAGKPITDKQLSKLVEQLKTIVERLGIQPTFFEFTTALAYMHFAQQQVDLAVIEVGMGGSFDATNVIVPAVSVITNISLDHTEYLGTTRLNIAGEKAGIIKDGVPAVTAEKDPAILALFRERCRQCQTRLFTVEQHLSVEDIVSSLREQAFTVTGVLKGRFTTPLLGRHQIDNACTALLTLHLLNQQGIAISLSDAQRGVAQTKWEGRLDVVSISPLILVDGAHNNHAAAALHTFLKTLPRYDVLVLGQKEGKDVSYMLEKIVPLFRYVIVTEGAYHPEKVQVLAAKLSTVHANVQEIRDVERAVMTAQSLLPSQGLLLVTGSLYMIAGALTALRSRLRIAGVKTSAGKQTA
jgi:dihydrofolate synthase / folylpolyglutamate synthase